MHLLKIVVACRTAVACAALKSAAREYTVAARVALRKSRSSLPKNAARRSTRVELAINRNAANDLGVTFSAAILQKANRVVG